MSYFNNAYTANNDDVTSVDDFIAAVEESSSNDADENVIEGRVTYVSPISTFNYNVERDGTRRGCVQNFYVTDILAKRSGKAVYQFRVTAWNEQVTKKLLKKDKYVRLRNFAWKANSFPKIPNHQSRYDAHLRADTIIETIPHIPHLSNN